MRAATLAAVVMCLFVNVGSAHGGACEAADQLLAGYHYDEAQKVYLGILKKDKSQQCAREGLEKIVRVRTDADRHLQLAAFYESVADHEMAKRESLEAARLAIVQRAPSVAGEKNTQDALGSAQWLAAAGLHDAALDKLKKAADSATPEKTLPNELRYLTGPRIYHLVRRHQEATFLALIAAALLLPWSLRHKLRPRLKIGSLDDPSGVIVGRGAALYLQQQLLSLTRAQGSGRIRFVTSPLMDIKVPVAISTAIPTTLDWIKPALELLSKIDWRTSLTLTGCLHQAVDRRGAGLTLVLTRDSAIISTTTLWQIAYGAVELPKVPADAAPASGVSALTVPSPDLSPYFDLAEPAAIWLLFQLLQVTGTKADDVRRMMGTAQWSSYALNAVAARAERTSKRRAQEMLIGAIRFDPENAAAHANLGLLLQKTASDVPQLRRALEQLTAARKKQLSSDNADPVFLAASYFVAYTHYALYERTNDRKELQNCARELACLVPIMRQRRTATESERVRNFISGALPSVDVMRIGVEVELGAIAPAAAHQDVLQYHTHATDETQYNLACTYSMMANCAPGSAEPRFYLDNSMNQLRFALHLNPERCKQAEKDCSLATLRSRRKAEFDALMSEIKNALAVTPPPAPPVAGDGSSANPAAASSPAVVPPPPPPPPLLITAKPVS